MNYNSGNARRNFYAKWDKLREEYRVAGMKEDSIQKMYEYDLAVFIDPGTAGYVPRIRQFPFFTYSYLFITRISTFDT